MTKIEKGFTLIELLVVISIIGVLIALSVFGLQGARQSSRDARRKADLEQIRSGLEIYKADCGAYPLSSGAGAFSLPGSTTLTGACPGPTVNTYISSVPVDPVPTNSSYGYSSNGTTYILCTALEQAPSSAMPNIGLCSGKCGNSACNYIVQNP